MCDIARSRRDADEIKSIVAVLGPRGRDGGLKEGQKLRVLLTPVPGGQRLQPIRVIIANDASIEAVVALSDTGKYVSVDVAASIPRSPTETEAAARETTGRRPALSKRL